MSVKKHKKGKSSPLIKSVAYAAQSFDDEPPSESREPSDKAEMTKNQDMSVQIDGMIEDAASMTIGCS